MAAPECFDPPFRGPVGTVKDGKVFIDERIWMEWLRMVFSKIDTTNGMSIGDIAELTLTGPPVVQNIPDIGQEAAPSVYQLAAQIEVLRNMVIELMLLRAREFGSLSEQNADRAFITGYADFWSQATNPPAPPAGVVRFHSSTTHGFTRFEQDNEAPTNIVLGRDNVFIARNTTAAIITHGSPVYVTGATGDVPNIGLAKADALATLPAIGIALDNIGINAFGQVMKLGVHTNHDTSAFSTGDQVWVSAATAGALVNVRPAYPNFVQRIGSVLVSGVGNGSLLIATAPFIGTQESGTNSATWVAAGTIRPAQVTPNAYLSSDSSPGISTTVTTASLVGKTITIKDGLITGFA